MVREYRSVVGLGSNLGDRRRTLADAVRALSACGRTEAVSALYESDPVGPPQPRYLNAAVLLVTPLEPAALLARLLEVERAAGRERRERWGPRVLDLDILWVEGCVLERDALRVPHPELARRAFALVPLLEVAPDASHPSTGVRYAELPVPPGPLICVAAAGQWRDG